MEFTPNRSWTGSLLQEVASGQLTVRTRTPGPATTREYQGNRSVAARPVAKSTGSEMCSWVINHPSFDRWQQLVARTHDPTTRPFVTELQTRAPRAINQEMTQLAKEPPDWAGGSHVNRAETR